MFTRFFALLPLALLVAAQAPKCSNSKPYCCDQAVKPDDPKVQTALESLSLGDAIAAWILSGLSNIPSDLVGLNCDPLDDTPSHCSTVPLCCAQDFEAGLLNTFCTGIPTDDY